MIRKRMKPQIMFFFILITLFSTSCNQTSKKKVLNPPAEHEKPPNTIELKGLYTLLPTDKSFSVDIKVDFQENNNSLWITNINGNIDKTPKKYRIFTDILFVTHDLEEFDRIIEEQRKKENGVSIKIIEDMISKIPTVDKYKIELTKSDTIKLFGSRVNFDLIKVIKTTKTFKKQT